MVQTTFACPFTRQRALTNTDLKQSNLILIQVKPTLHVHLIEQKSPLWDLNRVGGHFQEMLLCVYVCNKLGTKIVVK